MRAHVLNTRGVTRVNRGDFGGFADQEQSIAIAERLNSAEAMIRGYETTAARSWSWATSRVPAELEQRGVDVSRRFGAEFT